MPEATKDPDRGTVALDPGAVATSFEMVGQDREVLKDIVDAFVAREVRPRIVAMTANVSDDDRREAADAGMDGYITKPIRVPDLVGALLDTPRIG